MSGRGKSKRGGKRGAVGGRISTPGGSSTPVSQPTTPITESSTPINQSLINDSSEINSNSTPSIQEEEPGSSSLLKITPERDEFIPYDGTKKISSIIKSKYDEPWSDWTNIPVEVKMMWFGEFKKVCTWDLANHEEVVRIFHHKGAAVVRHSLADIRRGKSKGKWLQKSVLSTLQEKWKTDDEFLKKSERNKKNIAANVDGRVNHSGSVSIPESKRHLEKKLGREASFAELFKTLNYDKSKDKWHTPASQDAIEKFDKILESKSQNGEEVDKNALFLEVNGGINKKGRSWGFGAAIKCHSSTSFYSL